ncbi:MAG: chemotaxis protein, partial [Hoeflea sp.]|nr:chemotaxis protein [Hoeflea sp.]
MRRGSSPFPLSFAVLAVMFAFAASAQEHPAGQGAADQAGVEADGPAIGVKAPSSVPDDGSSGFSMAGGIDALEPYKLIRSLQFVQDSVVQGDHPAMEMQRFLLDVIDKRLRQAEQQVFDDPRNVDAALIYAMSGGNPETLEILAVGDKF